MSNRSLGRIEPTIAVILGAALAAALGLWLGFRVSPPQAAEAMQTATSASPGLERALLYPTPRALPRFSFERHDQGRFDNADLSGRWSLVFFGFTTCPDVCPTTLTELSQLEQRLPRSPAGVPLQVVFVSVDPERDSREKLESYVEFFNPRFVGLRAELDQLEPLTRALGIVYMKVPSGPGPFDYSIDHSSSILIVDPSGHLVGLFRPPHDPDLLARDLRRLMEGV